MLAVMAAPAQAAPTAAGDLPHTKSLLVLAAVLTLAVAAMGTIVRLTTRCARTVGVLPLILILLLSIASPVTAVQADQAGPPNIVTAMAAAGAAAWAGMTFSDVPSYGKLRLCCLNANGIAVDGVAHAEMWAAMHRMAADVVLLQDHGCMDDALSAVKTQAKDLWTAHASSHGVRSRVHLLKPGSPTAAPYPP